MTNGSQAVVITEDPEEYRQNVQREMVLARVMGEKVKLSWWLLAANVVIWIGAKLYGLHLVDNVGLGNPMFNAEQLALYTGMKVNVHIAAGEVWRLLSSQFVHLDLLHLMFNGYGIYLLGPILERFYGARRVFVLYLSAGTIGAAASYVLNEVPSGGASGAVYGLVGALLVFGLKYRRTLPKRVSKAFTVGLLPWVVLSLGIGFLDGIPMDNAAHLGGLISGGILALILASRLRPNRLPAGNVVVSALALIGTVLLLWTAVAWLGEVNECTQTFDGYLQCYPELEEIFYYTGK